jgi:UDP-3-O-[3-hydroxymyristoyl] glucosamine N-acyltransferase
VQDERARGGGDSGTPGLTAAAVARLTGGVLRPGSDGDSRVTRVAPLARADRDALAFYANPRYAAEFAATRAGAVLVAPALADAAGAAGAARIIVERPHEAMLAVLPALYRPAVRAPGVHPTAVIGRGVEMGAGVAVEAYAVVGDGARLGDDVWVGAHAVIGAGVVVGASSELRPHVTLYPGTELGRRVVVHAGARLGSDGYGYVYADGAHRKIPHVGRCVVEDDVEIGANTTIDRGSVDDTVIGAGTKIDNLVHLGHNVRVGRLCLLMAQVGVAGSAVVEDGAILAGQVGVGGHLTVGRGARVGGQGGVTGDVPPGATYSGYPARPHREALRANAALFKLAGLVRPLERLLAREGAAGEPAREREAGA